MTDCQDAPGVELIAKLVGEAAPTATHIDDWIDDHTKDAYARWMFLHFRLSAVNMIDFRQFIADRRLYCTFEGKRWRVVGASRMGDVWLNSNLGESYEPGTAGTAFYEERVAADGCSEWGANA